MDQRLQESDLLRRAREGDGSAFADLARPALPMLIRVAARYVRCRDEAEEIVQDALLKAFAHVGTYRGEAAFATWLVRITVNQALMSVRRKRLLTVPLDDLPLEHCRLCTVWSGPIETPERMFASMEAVDEIHATIGRMRPAYRVVLALKAGENTHEEIARQLEIPLKTVRVRLHRARRELRRMLARYAQRRKQER